MIESAKPLLKSQKPSSLILLNLFFPWGIFHFVGVIVQLTDSVSGPTLNHTKYQIVFCLKVMKPTLSRTSQIIKVSTVKELSLCCILFHPYTEFVKHST